VDEPDAALVPAADARIDQVTMVVAAAALALADGERLDGTPGPQVGPVDRHQLPLRRRTRLVGLECHALDPRRHVYAVALGQGHDRLLHIRTLAKVTAEALGLALEAQGVHGFDLDLEEPLDGSLDLGLARMQRHAERHLVVLRAEGGLLRHHGRTNQIVHADLTDGRGQLCLAHFSRASRCCTASLVKIKVSRRRMSYTLAPCCGRTSRLGMLTTARRKAASTVGPSMISADVQ